MGKNKGSKAGAPDVLFLRLDPELVEWIGKLADKSGKSRNEIGAVALEEFRSVMTMAGEMEAEMGAGCDPSDFVRVLGPSWVSRLTAMGLGTPTMDEGWRWHLAEQAELVREVEAARRERREKRGNR